MLLALSYPKPVAGILQECYCSVTAIISITEWAAHTLNVYGRMGQIPATVEKLHEKVEKARRSEALHARPGKKPILESWNRKRCALSRKFKLILRLSLLLELPISATARVHMLDLSRKGLTFPIQFLCCVGKGDWFKTFITTFNLYLLGEW